MSGRSTRLRATLSMPGCCRRQHLRRQLLLASRRAGVCAGDHATTARQAGEGQSRRSSMAFARSCRRRHRRRQPVSPTASPFASFSTMRCRPISCAPSSSAISVTPCVARPSSRISDDARAHQHAAVGDQHDLVVRPHQRGGDDLAVALALLDRDHSLGAAAVARVLDDRRALAVAVLGGGQHALRLVLGDQHRDHALRRRRASCRARRAPGGPSARTSSSSKRTALPPSVNSITSCLAVGERGADQVVACVEVDGDDAGLARVAELVEAGLLDRALRRGHEDVVVGREGAELAGQRQHDVDLLVAAAAGTC